MFSLLLGTNDFEALKYNSYGFAGFGFIIVFALVTDSQHIIGKKIKQKETDNE